MNWIGTEKMPESQVNVDRECNDHHAPVTPTSALCIPRASLSNTRYSSVLTCFCSNVCLNTATCHPFLHWFNKYTLLKRPIQGSQWLQRINTFHVQWSSEVTTRLHSICISCVIRKYNGLDLIRERGVSIYI